MTRSSPVGGRLVRAAALAVSCLASAACTPWPDEGTGGLAERRAPENPEIARLEARLQDAIARGARHAYAAQTAEAELQLVRVRRTWSAGFAEDFLTDYELLDVLVADIEAHLRRTAPLTRSVASGRKPG